VESTISTDMMRILLGGSPLARGELAEILRLAGVEPLLLARPQKRISFRQLAVIWSAVERAADDPDLGLHLGELRDGLPSGHVLFSALLNSPTLGQALERYCRYHDIMSDLVQPKLKAQGPVTVLSLTARSGMKLLRQHVEFTFSFVVSVLGHLASTQPKVVVHFAHRRPGNISEHLRVFGPAVHFAQPDNEIHLDRAYLETTIATADEGLLPHLEQYANSLLRRISPDTWSEKVAELLSRTLCDGKPSLAQLAGKLAVSQRTLQSKLKEEGTTYQAVLDRVRRDLATAYLESDAMSLAEIAFVLGYSDQSAFNHAFHKWTGDSPLRFRERRQDGPSHPGPRARCSGS
jgi:AraC-like DNA-binding protein